MSRQQPMRSAGLCRGVNVIVRSDGSEIPIGEIETVAKSRAILGRHSFYRLDFVV